MPKAEMKPVLKWAGGKSQIIDQLTAKMPKRYNNYFEPFIGGGAVFLAVAPQKAVINDINEQLINLYRQMREHPEEVIEVIRGLDAVPCDKTFYYDTRSRYNGKIERGEFDAECAALMVWINKHCFNGLYRVNGKGLFNVPYNNKVNGASINEENVRAIANYLQTADITISCCDFEERCKKVAS